MDNDFVLETSAGDYSLGPDAHGGKNPCVVVNSWIDHSHQNIDWGQFLRRSREDSKMKAFEDQTQTSQKQPSYNNLLNRLQYCDPMIWFNQVGKKVFPEIAILARLEFAKVDSSAVQERMFSAAAAAMSIKQTKMSDEVHEKRTVLFANKKFMKTIRNFLYGYLDGCTCFT